MDAGESGLIGGDNFDGEEIGSERILGDVVLEDELVLEAWVWRR